MAGEKKISSGYQLGLDLAHKTAEEEQKALPWYQEQALGYRRYISDVLWDQINSMKDALQFMRDFSLCCDDRTVRDRRVKDMPWKDIHKTFFAILNVNPKNSDGKERSLKTVKLACDMIHWTNMQDFFTALDETSLKNQGNRQVHEFLKAVESSFIEQWYIKKAS